MSQLIDEEGFFIFIANETNRTITVIDDKTDLLNPVTLGTSDYYDGPFESTYSLDYKQGVAGTCTEYTNIAVIDETNQSDSQTVTVCVGSDLTVSKTATTAFTRTYTWTIDKSVDKTKIILEGANPQSATFNYTVAVSHDSGTDSGWSVSGVITVSNPNDWQAISANITDLVNVGGGGGLYSRRPAGAHRVRPGERLGHAGLQLLLHKQAQLQRSQHRYSHLG